MSGTPSSSVPARLLVAGSVFWDDYQLIDAVLTPFAVAAREQNVALCIITGTAAGADQIARGWARKEDVELRTHDLNEGPYPVPNHRYHDEILTLQPDIVLAFKERFHDDWRSVDCVAGTEQLCRIAVDAGVRVLLNGERELTEAATTGEAADTR